MEFAPATITVEGVVLTLDAPTVARLPTAVKPVAGRVGKA
jgi:hypothetical protein